MSGLPVPLGVSCSDIVLGKELIGLDDCRSSCGYSCDLNGRRR